MTIKCGYCGKEKIIEALLRDYMYKKKTRVDEKTVYFCSYDCMRKAIKEKPDRYCEKRDL